MDKWRWWLNPGPKHRRSGLWGATASVGDESSVLGNVLSKGGGFCGTEWEGSEVLVG